MNDNFLRWTYYYNLQSSLRHARFSKRMIDSTCQNIRLHVLLSCLDVSARFEALNAHFAHARQSNSDIQQSKVYIGGRNSRICELLRSLWGKPAIWSPKTCQFRRPKMTQGVTNVCYDSAKGAFCNVKHTFLKRGRHLRGSIETNFPLFLSVPSPYPMLNYS